MNRRGFLKRAVGALAAVAVPRKMVLLRGFEEGISLAKPYCMTVTFTDTLVAAQVRQTIEVLRRYDDHLLAESYTRFVDWYEDGT